MRTAIGDRAAHADRLVDADRRRVLGPHEQADRGTCVEQPTAEVAHAALRKPRPRAAGSTQTCCSWTACGVQADASALKRIVPFSSPEPRPAFADLGARPPAKAVGIRSSGSTPISSSCAAAHAGTSRSRSAGVASRSPVSSALGRLVDHVDRLTGPVDPRRRRSLPARSQSSPTACSSPMIIRARPDSASRAKAAQPDPDGTTFAPTWQSAVRPASPPWPRTGPGRGAPRPPGTRAPRAPRRRSRGPASRRGSNTRALASASV